MASAAVGVTWIWLLLAGGAGAVSFGGAPLELDPKLSAIAPEECLWYASYSGQTAADPNSSNETEQLFAEPQVQKFAQEIQTQIMRAVRRAGGPGREQRVLASELPTLVKALMLRPFAAYVEDVRIGEGEAVELEAAFVLNTGELRGEVETSLHELMKLAQAKGALGEGELDDSVKWRRLKTPPKAPEVWIGWQDEYLIVAVGKETSSKLLKRLEGDAPVWLNNLRVENPVVREITVGYVNVTGILERAKPLVEHHHPGAWPIIERLGLTSIKALHGVSGYDEKGVTSMAHIVTDGTRPGLLGLAAHEPLQEGDLEVIPKDAMFAMAARLDPAEFWDNVVELVVQFHPEAKDKIEKGLWEVENHLSVNVRSDIVESLGDVWVAYLPGGDLFTSWFNSAAAVRVDDETRLREAAAKIVDLAKAELARHQGRATIVESTIESAGGEHTVMTLQFEEPVPFAPSWCITDEWLVFGLQSQAIRSFVDRDAEESLAQHDVVKESFEGSDGPAALIYQDTPRLARSIYPWVQIGVQMLSGQLRRQGIEINAAALPSMDTIVKHLRPSVSTMTHRADGFHFKSLSSLPSGGSIGSAPILAALLLPAVSNARMAARMSQDSNNMKQMALAALLYHDVHNAYPTDIYDKEGKPLLSWRVQLLPFMEQQTLYNEFHRDEPWDSEHNRQLLLRMPPQLMSAGGAEPGKTRYVALKGDGTVFRGKEPVALKHITDGTSRTLLAVQVADGHAVEWTKPADLDFDPDHPFSGLTTPQNMFLAALCDGSVHRFSLAISKETMQALATRAGDEVVDYSVMTMPPGPHDFAADEAAQ